VPEPWVPPCHRVAVDVQANTLTAVRQPVLQPLDVQPADDPECGMGVPQVVDTDVCHSRLRAACRHQSAQVVVSRRLIARLDDALVVIDWSGT
jgi:hypothetical protein